MGAQRIDDIVSVNVPVQPMGWVGGRVKHDQLQSATACNGGLQQQCMSVSPYYQYVIYRAAVRSTCSYSYSYYYSYS